jgi:hypothetical protein
MKLGAIKVFHMTRRFVLVSSFLLLTIVCFSQIHDSTWTKEVSLYEGDYIKSKKRISLFDSDTFTVYSTFNIVVENIKDFIHEHEIDEDKLLLGKFFNTAKSLDRNLVDIQNDKILKSRLDFRIAELIQRKKCLVYNKMSKTFESKIFVTNYIKSWWTGIRFTTLTNLQIMDLVTGAF